MRDVSTHRDRHERLLWDTIVVAYEPPPERSYMHGCLVVTRRGKGEGRENELRGYVVSMIEGNRVEDVRRKVAR